MAKDEFKYPYQVDVSNLVVGMGNETARTLKQIAEQRDAETGRPPMKDWVQGVAVSPRPDFEG